MECTRLKEAANVLLNLDKMSKKLQRVPVVQGRANSTITQLTAEITNIKKNALQAETQAQETRNALDLAKQQSTLEDGPSRLQSKLRRIQERAIQAEAQARSAGRQAGRLEEEFVELKNQYASLQHKTSAAGLTMETLGKVQQLKDAAEKLAGETKDKIRRLTGCFHNSARQEKQTWVWPPSQL